jgi:hypothetical protein
VSEPQKYTDTQLLDFLQKQNDKSFYTGRCAMRWSDNGRGWRLHETSRADATESVREAITTVMDREAQQ